MLCWIYTVSLLLLLLAMLLLFFISFAPLFHLRSHTLCLMHLLCVSVCVLFVLKGFRLTAAHCVNYCIIIIIRHEKFSCVVCGREKPFKAKSYQGKNRHTCTHKIYTFSPRCTHSCRPAHTRTHTHTHVTNLLLSIIHSVGIYHKMWPIPFEWLMIL